MLCHWPVGIMFLLRESFLLYCMVVMSFCYAGVIYLIIQKKSPHKTPKRYYAGIGVGVTWMYYMGVKSMCYVRVISLFYVGVILWFYVGVLSLLCESNIVVL